MSKLTEMIQSLCPDGVEYVTIGSLIKRESIKGREHKEVQKVYVVSNTQGLVDSEEYRDFRLASKDTSNYSVVMPRMFAYNPARLNVGSINWLRTDEPGLVSPMYIVFSVDESKIMNQFLYILLRSTKINNAINALTEVGARFRFEFSRWGRIEIPLPPLPIQQEIVRILDTFTQLQTQLQTELQLRRKQYNYYREHLLTFPEDVERKRLGDVCEIKTGKGITKADASEGGVFPIISGGQTPMGYFHEYNREANTVTISRVGAYAGFVSFIKERFYVNDKCFSVIPKLEELDPYFLYFYLKNKEKEIKDMQSVGGVPTINTVKVGSVLIPLPPIEKQREIASILDKFSALTTSLTEGIPAEIELRRKQYNYYRELLLTFKHKAL